MNAVVENRPYHENFMREAINMAELALRSDETPVGCVFVLDGKVIARGMNGTNATLNGTRHAEFVALSQIISTLPLTTLHETDLYVTVEPCIMCASALRQFRIRAVYFGCLNERFGGCGGVMKLHSDPSPDPPYPVYGGIFREEAILLLRRFYVQENAKAPEPKPKKNRELKTVILPVGARTSDAAGLSTSDKKKSETSSTGVHAPDATEPTTNGTVVAESLVLGVLTPGALDPIPNDKTKTESSSVGIRTPEAVESITNGKDTRVATPLTKMGAPTAAEIMTAVTNLSLK